MPKSLPPQALKPVVKVDTSTTVMAAIKAMTEKKVGAVVVLDNERPVGIFTERDVMIRVVLERREPETTPVSEVMTRTVRTVRHDEERIVAKRLMMENHIRHLPVVDGEGRCVAMLSMRHLLREDVSELEQTVWALVAEASVDGAGG